MRYDSCFLLAYSLSTFFTIFLTWDWLRLSKLLVLTAVKKLINCRYLVFNYHLFFCDLLGVYFTCFFLEICSLSSCDYKCSCFNNFMISRCHGLLSCKLLLINAELLVLKYWYQRLVILFFSIAYCIVNVWPIYIRA